MSSQVPGTTRRDLLRLSTVGLTGAALGALTTGCSKPLDKGADVSGHSSSTGTAMPQTPLHYRTLTDVAARIASGDLDSLQVTRDMLARLEALEPRLHTYITVTGDRALERAAAADVRRDAGEQLGPLHGVPIAVKDLCLTRGVATTAGHSFRKQGPSDYNATVVVRLEAAGGILLGKLATTEGAMVGYHRDFAVPRNPWGDGDRWPGVSSGGSGASTAAGLCFASLGTDTGGSIRYPSGANGLVGIKPTWGRVSRNGVLDLAPTLDHVGPMTRSVRDAARVLGVIAGRDELDPTSLPDPVDGYENGLQRGIDGVRIGWDESLASEGTAPYVASAVSEAVSRLNALGAEIVEVRVPRLEPDEGDAWTTLASVEAAAVHEDTFPARAAEYGVYFREFLTGGAAVSGVEYAKAVFARRRAIGRMRPLFDHIDLLACPTLATEAFRYDPDDAYGGFDSATGRIAGVPVEFFGSCGPFITVWDYNGYPTLSQPCGMSPDGLPLSLQLVGPPLTEALLCRVGHAYEQATEWHLKHPEL
ncbi:MAG: amidase [Acidobacteriota bacterium]|nr:amidase [Acidobacteriota bacterium]